MSAVLSPWLIKEMLIGGAAGVFPRPTSGRTHSQLRQSAAQLLSDVVQLLQLCLLLPPILAHNLLLQPLIWLEGERNVKNRQRRVGHVSKVIVKVKVNAAVNVRQLRGKTHEVSHVPLLSGFAPGLLVWLVLLFILNLFHKAKKVHVVLEDPGAGLYVDPEPIKNSPIVLDTSALLQIRNTTTRPEIKISPRRLF